MAPSPRIDSNSPQHGNNAPAVSSSQGGNRPAKTKALPKPSIPTGPAQQAPVPPIVAAQTTLYRPRPHLQNCTCGCLPGLGIPCEPSAPPGHCTCGCWYNLSLRVLEYYRPPISYKEYNTRPAAAAFFPAPVLLGTPPSDSEPEDYFSFDVWRPDRAPTAFERATMRTIKMAMARATHRIWGDMHRELGIPINVLHMALWYPTMGLGLWDSAKWIIYQRRLKDGKQKFWKLAEQFSGINAHDMAFMWRHWAGRMYDHLV